MQNVTAIPFLRCEKQAFAPEIRHTWRGSPPLRANAGESIAGHQLGRQRADDTPLCPGPGLRRRLRFR
jgi:hypothetical protein